MIGNRYAALFLTKDTAENAARIQGLLADLVGQKIESVQPLAGGRNSRAYVARCANGEQLAVKQYDRRGAGGRDPMAAEFAALQFLWDQGVRTIPRPVATDDESNCSVYAFIDGRSAAAAKITAADIDQATDFLGALRKLTVSPDSGEIAQASEACFSIQDALDNIKLRLTRLRGVAAESAQSEALHRFLDDRFVPFLDTVTGWAEAQAKRTGNTLKTELPVAERTLSPSDFGFHNAIRTEGGLVFLDFEHFGWDDPAKTISDFVLHPAMDLSQELKQRFVGGAIKAMGESGALAQRLSVVYQLFGLKWCMIFLNEFLKEGLERRQFAAGHILEADSIQAEQLAKAKQMLEQIAGEYEHFPYNV